MSYLGAEEREEISCGLSQGLSVREIARTLNRSPSTIRRETLRSGRRFDRARRLIN